VPPLRSTYFGRFSAQLLAIPSLLIAFVTDRPGHDPERGCAAKRAFTRPPLALRQINSYRRNPLRASRWAGLTSFLDDGRIEIEIGSGARHGALVSTGRTQSRGALLLDRIRGA